jgi:hypothetical protein
MAVTCSVFFMLILAQSARTWPAAAGAKQAHAGPHLARAPAAIHSQCGCCGAGVQQELRRPFSQRLVTCVQPKVQQLVTADGHSNFLE